MCAAENNRTPPSTFFKLLDNVTTQMNSANVEKRLAGVVALTALADRWVEQRQACINALCAYVRTTHVPPTPGEPLMTDEHDDWNRSNEEFAIRLKLVAEIIKRLRHGSQVSWQGLNFDFSGATFSGGTVDFSGATFSGSNVVFYRAQIIGSQVDFSCAQFEWAPQFVDTQFSSGEVRFSLTQFRGEFANFLRSSFSGAIVSFERAVIASNFVDFNYAEFSGGNVDFSESRIEGEVYFTNARFSGTDVSFEGAYCTGFLSFEGVRFEASKVDFKKAHIMCPIQLLEIGFFGGELDLFGVDPNSFQLNRLFGIDLQNPPHGLLLPSMPLD